MEQLWRVTAPPIVARDQYGWFNMYKNRHNKTNNNDCRLVYHRCNTQCCVFVHLVEAAFAGALDGRRVAARGMEADCRERPRLRMLARGGVYEASRPRARSPPRDAAPAGAASVSKRRLRSPPPGAAARVAGECHERRVDELGSELLALRLRAAETEPRLVSAIREGRRLRSELERLRRELGLCERAVRSDAQERDRWELQLEEAAQGAARLEAANTNIRNQQQL